MPTLELRVDATGVQQGLAQADQALDRTGQKAEDAARDVQRLGQTGRVAGNDLNAAFATTGGGLSVTRGIVGISDGLKSANTSMAAFAASQALLDLGRLSNDFRTVADSTGAAGGAFSALGAVIKANPLLTIATVIAGVATVMGLFGDETAEAADEWERLGENIRKARVDEETRNFLGADPTSARQSRLSALQGFASLYGPSGDSGREDLREVAARLGIGTGQALSILRANRGDLFGSPSPVGQFVANVDQFGAAGVTVPKEVARVLVRALYRDLLAQIESEAQTVEGNGGIGGGLLGYGINTASLLQRAYYPRQARDRTQSVSGGGGGAFPFTGFGIDFAIASANDYRSGQLDASIAASRAASETRMAEERQRHIEEAQIAMDELVASGRELGATLGDAFVQVASGAASAQQVIAQIISDLARAGARQAFAGLFGQIAGSFGTTATQASQNTIPGPTTPSG